MVLAEHGIEGVDRIRFVSLLSLGGILHPFTWTVGRKKEPLPAVIFSWFVVQVQSPLAGFLQTGRPFCFQLHLHVHLVLFHPCEIILSNLVGHDTTMPQA